MHNVGDILWIISKDKPGVLPFRVVEEVTKKTLLGSNTQYVIETPGKKARKVLKDDDEVYKSIDSVKTELLSRAESAINKMLASGTNLISIWTEDTHETSNILSLATDETSKKEENNLNNDTIGEETVTLPGGQKVKINFKGDIP